MTRAAAILLPVGLMLLAGCSPAPTEAVEPAPLAESAAPEAPAAGEEPPRVTHVHALDLDEQAGLIYIATHDGVLAAPVDDATGAALRFVSEWRGDAMGMVRSGDRLLISGHPPAYEAGPVNVGVVEFGVSGGAPVTLALEGEADFHAMATVGQRVAGWNSVTGTVKVSDDGGLTWREGPAMEVRALAFTPDGERLLATTPDGVQVSADGGLSFGLLDGSPFLLLVAAVPAGSSSYSLVGLDVEGVLHASAEGDVWSTLGIAPMVADALAVGESGRVLLANTDFALLSNSDVTEWEQVLRF
jgi:hypothetical protein